MPELPEVETIARELRPLLEGRTIVDGWFDWPNQIKHPSPAEFVPAVRGRRILGVARRAKWVILDLSASNDRHPEEHRRPVDLRAAGAARDLRRETVSGAVLAIQVKMTGQLTVVDPRTPRDKHVHAVFDLDDGKQLRLRDTRKFGRLGFYRKGESGAILGAGDVGELFDQFGPEPLAADFRPTDFRKRLAKRKGRLKTLLMDQAFLAGVGNIYADEALWRAQLHPLRSASNLNQDQARRLYRALRAVLAEAIERRGSSVDDYLAPEGRGDMQNYLNVYGRTGKACPRCGRPVRRIVLNARSSHYCSWCQRLPAAERRTTPRPLLRAAN
jgi:formamidopyrimidine-DNA glycosylase